MASNVLAKKFSPAFHYWKCSVRSNKKMIIILTALHMIAAPAVFISAIMSTWMTGRTSDSEIYIVIGTITTAVAVFMGIFIAISSFNCLHKKSVVDMKLSLPMTTDQRFFSDYLSGLFTYLAPFLAAQVISLLLAAFGLFFMEGRTFYRENYYGDLTPYVCDYFGEAAPQLLKLVLGMTLVMLMLYTLTVLITICCGNKFECIAYSIGINVVIPVTILMVTVSMFEGIFGIDPDLNAFRIFMATSPAGGVFSSVLWAFDGEDYISDYMNPFIWMALFFLMTALMGAVAFILHRGRRAEQVSKPFVFKLAYYIIITGVMFCFCAVFTMAGSFIPAIITTAVIYMIAEIVTNRGFKNFKFSIIKYIATMAAAYAIIAIGQATDGFGALHRVPSSMTVASVEIGYHGIYNDFSMPGTNGVVLKDRDNIKAVIDAHKTILKEYDENLRVSSSMYSNSGLRSGRYSYYDDNVIYKYTIPIKYRLINGGVIEREYYYVLTKDVNEILSAIDYTDEYKEQLAKFYSDRIKGWGEEYAVTLEASKKSETYNSYTSSNVRLSRVDRSSRESNGYKEKSIRYLYENNFFERFAEAYSTDIMEISPSNYSLSDKDNRYTVYYLENGLKDIRIPKSFGNSLRVLSEYGFLTVAV
ncbi:MAG: hypothetical protein J1E40_01280 [Oscillospiraceae bacterium]|nr:hypothetical protein [Oscillospiraceae bacterium]